MKEIWFIRHGESAANAGLPTNDPASIPLTPLGHQQAMELATEIKSCPGLFIMTPYLRTQQTANPMLEKFPDVPVEIWPLHEYDFLSPAVCQNTTIDERKPWVKEFWSKCDPDYIHGEGAESFKTFNSRVIQGLRKLQELEERFIIVFAHGQVIRAISQYIVTGNEQLQMETFRDKMLHFEVPNTGIFKCSCSEDRWQMQQPQINLLQSYLA